MTTRTGISLQVDLIRQIQAENGLVACYATPAAVKCTKKQGECAWRHDCFEDAGELEVDWRDPDAVTLGESWFQQLD